MSLNPPGNALLCQQCPFKKRAESQNILISNNEGYALNLLRLWMTQIPSDWKPGAWDYNKAGAQLVEDTAIFLGISDPWKDI